MRNMAKYRAPMDVVEAPIMYAIKTPHHGQQWWKNRSPVLSERT